MDLEIFEQVRADLKEIFPPETDEPRFRYVKQTWIFPNHFDITVRFAKQLAEKYDADVQVCMLAALLHDAGLAYKRDRADSIGHEERSVEYVYEFLPKYGYDADTVKAVANSVIATEPKTEVATIEAKVVRTADALAHIQSVHYLAKAVFSPNWDDAIAFVERKVHADYGKICFEEERLKIQPIYNYFVSIIEQYKGKDLINL